MSAVIVYAAALCAGAASWFIRGALAVESAERGAAKLGILPPWWELALFLLASACVVFLLKPSRDRVLPLFATALCIAPWLPGVDAPALFVWTGPLSIAAWFAAVAAVLATAVAGRGRTPARWDATKYTLAAGSDAPIAVILAVLFFAAVAFGVRDVRPDGDEPHYLVITQSLLEDADLQIENNYAQQDYTAYYARPLKPDFLVRGRNAAIYSIHAPGLPAIVAPAYALGGYTAVVVFLVFVAAAGIGLLWKLAFDLTQNRSAAWFGAAATAGATPVALQAFAVYPDGLAGVLTLTGVWALMRRDGSRLAWFLHGGALSLLPWLHSRFAVLSGLLGIMVLMRLRRKRGQSPIVLDSGQLVTGPVFLALPIASALLWFAFFWRVYGTPNPAAAYGGFFDTQASWSFVTSGLAGLLFDQQFGILIYAPVVLIALAGFIVMLRGEDQRLAIELAILVVPYLLVTTHVRMWWAGQSAPARFAVPVLWLGGLCAARAWAAATSRTARGTALGALAISAVTTLAVAHGDGGRLAYNTRDGYSRWLEWISPLGDLPLGFPSFFRWTGPEWTLDLQVLAVLAAFGVAYLLLRLLESRIRGAGAFALLMLAMYACAGMAAIVTLWSVNDSTGMRPAVSQLKLLTAAQAERRLAVVNGGSVRRARVDEALQRLRIESPPRLLAGERPPALVLPGWFPAGRYRIEAPAASDARWELVVLRSGGPIRSAASSGSRGVAVEVSFPVDVPAVILRGTALRPGTLRPIHVLTRRERFADTRAESGRRYGNVVVWPVEGAFDEPAGLWVSGSATSRIVVQPDGGAFVRLDLRNGAARNDVTVEVEPGGGRRAYALAPGQEQSVEVPVDPARGAALVHITCSAGFRPSEVEPGNNDSRLLGVWLTPR
ncbi:MAG TPA: hypothetical protein VK886_11750 [Vicinamibacterales bacterium]|nr:hypothetical protein [Vicinamibacterales bacterium]